MVWSFFSEGASWLWRPRPRGGNGRGPRARRWPSDSTR
jgi:hypothetical protein